MSLFSFLIGRVDGSDDLPDILSETEEGFADLVFRITESRQDRHDRWRLTARGTHQGRRVGLAVELEPEWTEGSLAEDLVAYRGVVRYRSIGSESDALVAALKQLYGVDAEAAGMVDMTTFAAITLEGDPARLDSKPLKIKLFFEKEEENHYAEVYTNIDLPQKKLEIREKDESYREPLLRALAGQ